MKRWHKNINQRAYVSQKISESMKGKKKPCIFSDAFKKNQYTIQKDGCWIFNGCKDAHGYGRKFYSGESYSVHKLAYTLSYSNEMIKIMEKDSMLVCHTCSNRACINPEHLILRTPEENMKDILQKRTLSIPIEIRKEIRDKYFAGGSTKKALSLEYKTSVNIIDSIINNPYIPSY